MAWLVAGMVVTSGERSLWEMVAVRRLAHEATGRGMVPFSCRHCTFQLQAHHTLYTVQLHTRVLVLALPLHLR